MSSFIERQTFQEKLFIVVWQLQYASWKRLCLNPIFGVLMTLLDK